MNRSPLLEQAIGFLRGNVQGEWSGINPIEILSEVERSVDHLVATRHPLGFIHIDITPMALRPEPVETLRMHLWQTDVVETDDAGALHDHTWALSSLVLVGGLKNRNYVASRDSDGKFDGVRVTYGTANEFVIEDRWNLALAEERDVRAGQGYRIPPGVVHETEIVLVPTVTLVRAAEDPGCARQGPLLLASTGTRPTGTSVRERLDSGLVRTCLESIATSILGHGPN
jgi:hypothetical protein